VKRIALSGLIAFAAWCWAQPAAGSFEVASVKLISPDKGSGLTELSDGPGRIDYSNITLKLLITRAGITQGSAGYAGDRPRGENPYGELGSQRE